MKARDSKPTTHGFVVRSILSAAAVLFATLLTGCAALPMVERPSANQDERIRILVIHFTDENLQSSLDILTQPHRDPVSAHYVVSAPGDAGKPATIYRLVDESKRAWHAGESQWQGRHALNDQSIGIEIVYESHCPRTEPAPPTPTDADAGCAYPDYPPEQIALVQRLARDILARHHDIDPTRVVGHADIAPNRKPDPGPRFPWHALYEAGVGAWYLDADVARFQAAVGDHPPLRLLQQALAAYGYGLEASDRFDRLTRDVLFAFQTHFLPGERSGAVDGRSVATVLALLARYRPAALEGLRQDWRGLIGN